MRVGEALHVRVPSCVRVDVPSRDGLRVTDEAL